MRIIAGRFRGTKLADLGTGDTAAHLRPTSDRVRESLFSMLASGRFGPVLAGAKVLDLFAGTGALGLEALSRGASHVTFVENGRKSLSLIHDNIIKCHGEDQTRVLRQDVLKLKTGTPHDLIFLDPPYGKGMGERALSLVSTQGWVASGALVVWEENTAIAPPLGLEILDQRKFGGTIISLLRAEL